MTRCFAISPDVNVRNITDWFILNTKVQRMTVETFRATAYTDFADLHKAYADDRADLVFANAADTAMLVRDRGYIPVAAARGVCKEASVVVAADSNLHTLADLAAMTGNAGLLTAASTDAPDVIRISRILLEPANLGAHDVEVVTKPNPVLVAKAVMRDEVTLGFLPSDAFEELSAIVRGELRILIASSIYVVRNSLLASPAISDKVEAIWSGLEAMNRDGDSAKLLVALGAANGWERISYEETYFMIDLMDALSQQ